ncbi:MAG TPA: phosphate signaling complex protein PhoU [Phototrophicaceae bacterium]|nr:phosphate signaling complex protein PhoU [Phototrophicaceae bacterium]
MRKQFGTKLNELRDEILEMGKMVEEELKLALKALNKLDKELARQVIEFDASVNAKRFAIEEKCVQLIATQQPAASDLRAIVAVMNMIVDLERMGDQAKGIAKVIPRLNEFPGGTQPTELKQMGDIVGVMLSQCMEAYAQNNVGLAEHTAKQDDEVDHLYATFFAHIIAMMAETKKQKVVQASYEVLRAGQELERFGDLATNIAERVIYIATGKVHEVNVEPEDPAN